VIEVDSVALQVHSESKGISDFGVLFTDIEIFISTSDTTVSLGTIEATTGSTVSLEEITNENLDAVQSAMKTGSFSLGVRGDTQDPLPDDFDLKISLDVQFSAYP
jgi:hypothetical protein